MQHLTARWATLRHASVGDYGMSHQPSDPDEYGAWLYDLTAMVPDVYTRPQNYTGFRQWVGEVGQILKRTRGNPSAIVTIYRALPGQHRVIERGNWVTLTRQYAQMHLDSNGDTDWHIVSADVRADQVGFGGDDLMEWGYFGPTIQARAV